MTDFLNNLTRGIPVDPLPPPATRDFSVPHAPVKCPYLSQNERKLAVSNALRYFPQSKHNVLVSEFAHELKTYGHIYMYRFKPSFPLKAYPFNRLPAKSRHAAAIMHMILNNLDPAVAQFPHELVTYGGNGQVFANWAQFWLTMKYLSTMSDSQTLSLYSGHPMGLFPSHSASPRLVITNGMVIPNYSSREEYERMFALGVSMYGQMTAGSFCYIGPQGIVHGTTLTLLNAGRKFIGSGGSAAMRPGCVYVTSGLGGMSGAQPKAAIIAGCICVVAEVDGTALRKRHAQGWLQRYVTTLDECVTLIREARTAAKPASIGYLGNVVDLWERLADLADAGDMLVELGSDQTSLHNPHAGGYYPVQLSVDESRQVMHEDLPRFRNLVSESLRRQVTAINRLTAKGMHFWDYGNAFLLEASRAGADISDVNRPSGFRYPSYVEAIMGDIFSLGFGPFRWVCTSGEPADLERTDAISCAVIEEIIARGVAREVQDQYSDNVHWIRSAGENKLVVGSQARILYSDAEGRVKIALAFNQAVADGTVKAPIVLSRDHHDVSGTDSPFRETANITDGSAFSADMAVQNVIGDAFRGATWVALHNGGGVGWGEVMNGGFGLVLDGSAEAAERAQRMLHWDVNNGVARRCWAGNENADRTARRAMTACPELELTLPYHVADDKLLEEALAV